MGKNYPVAYRSGAGGFQNPNPHITSFRKPAGGIAGVPRRLAENAARRAALKGAATIGGRLIPWLGWALLAWDLYDWLNDDPVVYTPGQDGLDFPGAGWTLWEYCGPGEHLNALADVCGTWKIRPIATWDVNDGNYLYVAGQWRANLHTEPDYDTYPGYVYHARNQQWRKADPFVDPVVTAPATVVPVPQPSIIPTIAPDLIKPLTWAPPAATPGRKMRTRIRYRPDRSPTERSSEGPKPDEKTDTDTDTWQPAPRPQPTRPREKERKFKKALPSLVRLADRGVSFITETQDNTRAVYRALPEKYQTCFHYDTACQAKQVYDHFDELDVSAAVVNILLEQLEDLVYGKVSKFAAYQQIKAFEEKLGPDFLFSAYSKASRAVRQAVEDYYEQKEGQ